jgi:Na+-translocating ferredoxin:NAD+ oxidoreductase RnfD subunit
MASFTQTIVTVPTSRWPRFLRASKGVLSLAFLPLLVVGGLAGGWATLGQVGSAVLGACLVDLLVSRIVRNRWTWPTSAALSGLIVAFVLGPETPWTRTLAIGALATASKYLFATRRWHAFNPAALALLVSIPLFGTGQSWWGALADLPWPWVILLLAGGALVVERVNRFPLVLTFAGLYFGLFTVVALVSPLRVAEMFRPPFVQAAIFLACFMLTDPPTSPGRYADQVWIGALVALTTCLADLLGAGQAYLLLGLLVGNLALVWRRTHR